MVIDGPSITYIFDQLDFGEDMGSILSTDCVIAKDVRDECLGSNKAQLITLYS